MRPTANGPYRIVEVPPEDPEKLDHGDLDFLVVFPRDGLMHGDIKHALDATESVPMEGNRTSHFAVPMNEAANSFVQVDVHVCADEEELQSLVFYHSYGGLSMMLGRMAKTINMTLSTSALKISNATSDDCHPPSFKLSENFHDIMAFFGLSIVVWRAGFTTRRAIFDWLASSRFFFPDRLAPHHVGQNSSERRRADRDIYQAFAVFVAEIAASRGGRHANETGDARRSRNHQVHEEALEYFGKREEYDQIVHSNWVRMRLKTTFTGLKVVEWTNLWGKRVSEVMKETRQRCGGDDALALLDEEEVKRQVLCVYKDLKEVWDHE
ncbi:hypothetical protein OE88DRAFT_1734547 [Heliocybe sulcata]|uniref:Uncharacterized protein n=1 Tax=Heliocybe sulcata TaxID=5364 RepID=A0A5C3N7V8_9AGAM|nr:hypothetical protein OE88DRAFT_1734547 [Heliocybe sulcata]